MVKGWRKEDLQEDNDAGGNHGGRFWTVCEEGGLPTCQMLLIGQVG